MSISPPIVYCAFSTVLNGDSNANPLGGSSGATLTLAHGRRYGLIGRNGEDVPL